MNFSLNALCLSYKPDKPFFVGEGMVCGGMILSGMISGGMIPVGEMHLDLLKMSVRDDFQRGNAS